MIRAVLLSSLVSLVGVVGGCDGAPAAGPPSAGPASVAPGHACEDAYEDLVRYFDADPDRRRPPALHADTFVATCRELAVAAQQCLLFSYMQAHAAACEEARRQADPDVMRRVAAMVGK